MSLEACPVCDRTPRVLVAVRHPVLRRSAAQLLAREGSCWASSDVVTGEITEIDVNPLVAFGEGKGVVALDALIVTQ